MGLLEAAGWLVGVAGAVAIVIKCYRWAKIVCEGQRCQLRTVMVNIYYRYLEYQKIPQYEAENFFKCYEAYKALNGNSFVDEIKKEVSSWTIIKEWEV